ncbi:MAG: hypothetical protein OXG39_05400 [Chloroflexi bacterium]|nr:hypothetical protein [Chloroflexota bacterium]
MLSKLVVVIACFLFATLGSAAQDWVDTTEYGEVNCSVILDIVEENGDKRFTKSPNFTVSDIFKAKLPECFLLTPGIISESGSYLVGDGCKLEAYFTPEDLGFGDMVIYLVGFGRDAGFTLFDTQGRVIDHSMYRSMGDEQHFVAYSLPRAQVLTLAWEQGSVVDSSQFNYEYPMNALLELDCT